LKDGDESNGKNEQDRHMIILVDKVKIKILPVSFDLEARLRHGRQPFITAI
jgi:hypothetical protein